MLVVDDEPYARGVMVRNHLTGGCECYPRRHLSPWHHCRRSHGTRTATPSAQRARHGQGQKDTSILMSVSINAEKIARDVIEKE